MQFKFELFINRYFFRFSNKICIVWIVLVFFKICTSCVQFGYLCHLVWCKKSVLFSLSGFISNFIFSRFVGLNEHAELLLFYDCRVLILLILVWFVFRLWNVICCVVSTIYFVNIIVIQSSWLFLPQWRVDYWNSSHLHVKNLNRLYLLLDICCCSNKICIVLIILIFLLIKWFNLLEYLQHTITSLKPMRHLFYVFISTLFHVCEKQKILFRKLKKRLLFD